MTVALDDPLIAAMAIRQTLPLHESSRRLRELYPECPRVHGVAVMADVSRRRWWPLEAAMTTDRLRVMFDAAATGMERRAAVQQLAASLVHAVIGRVVALVVLEGRAWDTGLENLWVHVDSEGAIDWVGVVDPTLRVLPDDPCLRHGGASRQSAAVPLPSEAALTTWVAHRCHRTLVPLFARLQRSATARSARPRCGTSSDPRWWRRDPGAAACRLRRTDRHAPEPGGPRRDGRIRPAGAGAVQTRPRKGVRACKIRAALPMLSRSSDNDRAGVLRAAETPGLLDRRAPCLVHGARPFVGPSGADGVNTRSCKRRRSRFSRRISPRRSTAS